jgi:ABC-type multidrug transport system ATPase subunit
MGSNGSGKSTFLRCLNCLLNPTFGSLKHKFNIPFPMLFQKPVFFQNTVQYNFEVLSKIKKINPSMEWYRSFQLDKISKKRIDEVSGGEKQKIYLSRIMSVNSEVIIMDEPNQNLDIENTKKLIKLLLNEKNINKTIILTMHDKEIVKQIADKIVLLNQGEVEFYGSVNNFLKI